MRLHLIITPCRASFALCTLLVLLLEPERAADITFGEAPRLITIHTIGRLIE